MVKGFWNIHGLLNAGDDEEVSENTLLFSAEYLLMKKDSGLSYKQELDDYIKFIEKCRVGPGLFKQFPEPCETHERYMSHDNLTGLVSVSKTFGLSYHIEIWDALKRQLGRYDNVSPDNPTWDRIMHPRDIIYWGMLAGNPICWSLCWVLWIIQLVTCIQKYKYRNGNEIIKTDGKILTWVRCRTLGWKLSSWFYEKVMKLRGFLSWYHVFCIYFKEGHPIRRIFT